MDLDTGSKDGSAFLETDLRTAGVFWKPIEERLQIADNGSNNHYKKKNRSNNEMDLTTKRDLTTETDLTTKMDLTTKKDLTNGHAFVFSFLGS